MSIEEKIDQAKGAAKEGVGKLTGDKKIEKEVILPPFSGWMITNALYFIIPAIIVFIEGIIVKKK